jgi:hypothetical protein
MDVVIHNPRRTLKKVLGCLSERPRRVLEERFGLVSSKPRTLESIGRVYGITRERVRQIESAALKKLRESDEFFKLSEIFDFLKNYIRSLGGAVEENYLFERLVRKEEQKPPFYFLLVLGEDFFRLKEDQNFHICWTIDLPRAEKIKTALERLHNEFSEESLFSEDDVFDLFKNYLVAHLKEEPEKEVMSSLLKISKLIGINALGEWGIQRSAYIRPKATRDYSFLAMRKHGSPLHFSEVAKKIEEIFNREVHVQTVHNELIKDPRFVLVGRGLYALRDWGYDDGTVRDVIARILKENGPLLREEIIKKVLRERYIKENTILVNLQDRNFFKKDEEGRYFLVS